MMDDCLFFIVAIEFGMKGKKRKEDKKRKIKLILTFLTGNSTKMESLQSPITSDTVLIVNASNGDVLGSWGANQ